MTIATAESANLIPDPGFENDAKGWRPYGEGFRVVAGAARNGSKAIACAGTDEKGLRGAVAEIALDQKDPVPVFVEGWSRAEGVSGGSDNDYSIYIDCIYTDGTPLWGTVGRFKTGSHDWEKVSFWVTPEKPIRRLLLHALFRHHKGTVYFDDISLSITAAGGGLFDGAVVAVVREAPPSPGIRLDGRTIRAGPVGSPAGFFIRDVAAGSGFHRPDFSDLGALSARCPVRPLDLEFNYAIAPLEGKRSCAITAGVRDLRGQGRAVTVYFAIPVRGDTPIPVPTWCQDMTGSEKVLPGKTYRNVFPIRAGLGAMSRYPFAALVLGDVGIALGAPMDSPRVQRFAYDEGRGILYAAVDLGIAPEKPQADLRLVAFTFSAEWGFRSALARYAEIHPAFFEKRTPDEGLWMAFFDIAKVKGAEDFGFVFKEGTNNLSYDEAHGILTFRYTEPQSHWQAMPAGADRSYEGCVAFLEGAAKKGTAAARATIASGIHDQGGRYVLSVEDAPWCKGCVFTLNPSPGLAGEVTKARLNYTVEDADKRYGDRSKGALDGEYLDSLEGWSDHLNFRRDHFAAADLPLVFDPVGHRPCILNAFGIYEFTRLVSRDLHRRSKLLMANAVPVRFGFLMHLIDAAGIEINWKRDQYRPDPEWWMNYRRAMCGKKPYLFLMNTDFTRWTYEDTERYMRRSLHYGFHPSFFSANASTGHYFSQPKLYDRDRPLFRRYVPLIRRMGKAGWEPLTLARVDRAGWRVERYGDPARGTTFFSLLNLGPSRSTAQLSLDGRALGASGETYRFTDVFTGKVLREGQGSETWQVPVTADAGDTVLLEWRARPERPR